MDTDENGYSTRPPPIKADPLAEGVDLSTRNGENENSAWTHNESSDPQLPDNQSNNGDSPPSNEKRPNDHIEPKLLLNLKQEPGLVEAKPNVQMINRDMKVIRANDRRGDRKTVSKPWKRKIRTKPWNFMETQIGGWPVVFKRSPFPDDRKKMGKNITKEGTFDCGGCKKSLMKKKICVTIEIEESETETEDDNTTKEVEITSFNLECGRVCHLCNEHFTHRHELQKHLIDVHDSKEMAAKVRKYDWHKVLSKEEIERREEIEQQEDHQEKVCERIGCHQLIIGKKAYMNHIYTVHKGEPVMFECSVCQKTFKKKPMLNQHKYSHTGLSPHLCPECGKQFSSKSNMLTHMKIHQGLANRKGTLNNLTQLMLKNKDTAEDIITNQDPSSAHVCDECGKSFYNYAGLQVHKASHDKTPKLYRCKHCPETFTKITDFKWHKQGHLGHKQYTCEECGRKCSSKTNWEEHMNKHTGARPFTCKECGKGFKTKATLVGHIKNMHTKLPTLNPENQKPKNLACPYCEEMFTSRIPMGKHVSKVHPQMYPIFRSYGKGTSF